jgi:hypothetical protein
MNEFPISPISNNPFSPLSRTAATITTATMDNSMSSLDVPRKSRYIMPDTDPLIKACKRGDTSKLLELLQQYPTPQEQADFVNSKDKNGSTAIFHTVWPGHLSTLHCLLSYGAKPNFQNNKNNTALHLACEQQHFDLILLLISYDASIHLQNINGQTCYDMVQDKNDRVKMENFVKKCWADVRRGSSAANAQLELPPEGESRKEFTRQFIKRSFYDNSEKVEEIQAQISENNALLQQSLIHPEIFEKQREINEINNSAIHDGQSMFQVFLKPKLRAMEKAKKQQFNRRTRTNYGQGALEQFNHNEDYGYTTQTDEDNTENDEEIGISSINHEKNNSRSYSSEPNPKKSRQQRRSARHLRLSRERRAAALRRAEIWQLMEASAHNPHALYNAFDRALAVIYRSLAQNYSNIGQFGPKNSENNVKLLEKHFNSKLQLESSAGNGTNTNDYTALCSQMGEVLKKTSTKLPLGPQIKRNIQKNNIVVLPEAYLPLQPLDYTENVKKIIEKRRKYVEYSTNHNNWANSRPSTAFSPEQKQAETESSQESLSSGLNLSAGEYFAQLQQHRAASLAENSPKPLKLTLSSGHKSLNLSNSQSSLSAKLQNQVLQRYSVENRANSAEKGKGLANLARNYGENDSSEASSVRELVYSQSGTTLIDNQSIKPKKSRAKSANLTLASNIERLNGQISSKHLGKNVSSNHGDDDNASQPENHRSRPSSGSLAFASIPVAIHHKPLPSEFTQKFYSTPASREKKLPSSSAKNLINSSSSSSNNVGLKAGELPYYQLNRSPAQYEVQHYSHSKSPPAVTSPTGKSRYVSAVGAFLTSPMKPLAQSPFHVSKNTQLISNSITPLHVQQFVVPN